MGCIAPPTGGPPQPSPSAAPWVWRRGRIHPGTAAGQSGAAAARAGPWRGDHARALQPQVAAPRLMVLGSLLCGACIPLSGAWLPWASNSAQCLRGTDRSSESLPLELLLWLSPFPAPGGGRGWGTASPPPDSLSCVLSALCGHCSPFPGSIVGGPGAKLRHPLQPGSPTA